MKNVCVLIFLLCSLHILLCSAFNLEDRLPIIKVGPPGSLFGLSVALHHVTEDVTNLDDAVMLVGAPTADAEGYHSDDSYKPGALFKCGVNMNEGDCQSIVIDDAANSLQVNNSNQWLGVVVRPQKPGGKVAVCAHKFTIRGGGGSRGIIWEAELGRCYVLKNNLQPIDFQSQHIPCIGKLDPDGSYTQAFYGYSQAGTSVAFADDVDEDIVFGMPGPLHWTGAVYSNELQAQSFFPVELWSDDGDVKGSIHQNSYMGFSLDTGRLYGRFINYVAGAPRANDTGSVVVFEKEEDGVAKVLTMKEILQGENLASSFGYDVKVVDITGDGREDLLVGAPQYYDKEKRYGGAVYIYVNKGLSKIGPTPTKILYGDVDSSFGNSISTLGDINMDGTNDIAIGAPGADKGSGAVYIFHGNPDPNLGVYEEPAQVIHAYNLTTSGLVNFNITGFGYSLDGGLDMDMNEYPDLLVGSLSEVAVMYRSRPIINVYASIKTSVNKINLNPDANEHTVAYTSPVTGITYQLITFNAIVCMNYTSTPVSFNEAVNMEFTARIDSERLENDLRSRGTFSPTNLQQDSITQMLKLKPQSSRQSVCVTLPVYISHEVQDKLSPIQLDLSFNVLEEAIPTTTGVMISLNKYPVLNNQVARHDVTNVQISKDCGPDEICRSQIMMNANYVVKYKGSDDWVALEPGNLGVPTLLLGTEEEIGLRVNIANPTPGEDAHQAKLRMYLPPILNYVGLDKVNATGTNIGCTTVDNNASFVECSLGNPLETDSRITAIVKLENDERLYKTNGFVIQLQVLTSSLQPGHDDNVTYPVNVRVQAKIMIDGYTNVDQVRFGGEVVGESAVKVPQDAGTYITHGYEVINAGTSKIDDVYVNITWPQVIHNGKWLLYLIDTQVTGSGATNETICRVPTDRTNPLNLKYRSSGATRRKREAGGPEDKVSQVVSPPTSSHKTLKCDETADSAKCVYFLCYLGTLEKLRKVDINLRAVVWNSTFLEEYNGVGEIRVFSKAEVVVTGTNIQYSPTSVVVDEVATSVLSEEVIAPQQEVKLWIIVVATLAGVILLVIIVLLLWRCGFFERRRMVSNPRTHKARRSRNVKDDDVSSNRILQHQTSWQKYGPSN
ncbi:integrin alpha-6 isoform X2 [Ciona intestinalis]